MTAMENRYDVFISYKRKSLPTANNLYYRLTTRGYSTFFDLEEMGRDNFNTQLLNYIENAKDVFVILEEGSLDGCQQENWEEKDWFCHEIAFALEKKKNIIPILLNGYKMPSEDFFPDKLKELSLKNAPEFNFSFFEAYLDKLIEKDYLLSKPNPQEKATSVFKFYSNENCQVFKEGKLVCSLEGMADEPYYLPVPRKGDYSFKLVNNTTSECRKLNEVIDAKEEKNIEIKWDRSLKKKNLCGMRRIFYIAIVLFLSVLFIPIRFWIKTNELKKRNNNEKEIVLPYQELRGLKTIPVKINGVSMDMIFDTGYSGVSLSSNEFHALYKNEKISYKDIIGTVEYSIADSSFVEEGLINLKEVQIGGDSGITLYNVEANVALNLDAPVLLGNGVIDKVASVEIDNVNKIIKFKRR